ncbi:MAG TPA: metal ABC transporter permease [Bacilli bacterium]
MDIFAEYFFQRALIGGILIGFMAPLIGIFLVLRRLAMIGDTIAHVTIAGVALGFLIQVSPIGLGLVFAVLAAFGIEHLRKAYKTYAELSIAIILSTGVALASILFTLGRGFNMNVTSYLFGSIYTLDKVDLILIFTVTIMVVIFVLIHFKELFLLSFDEDAASVSGLPLRMLNIMVTVLTALVISVAIKIFGGLLVSALLTIPVACSLAVGKGFRQTVWMAVIYSEIAVIGGLSIAGVWNLAPGGTVVILLVSLLIVTLIGRRSFKA